ncbi:MAG: hypothetical protein H0X26_04290 [Alphaproteobacteria bacterium]|nr:hypothetical protein [Alphaproteobacteria bacterium]
MSKFFSILISGTILSAVSFSAFAMENPDDQKGKYQKLAIIAEVNPKTSRAISDALHTKDEVQGLGARGIKVARKGQSEYHISIDCFNHDHPESQNLHKQFGVAEENYLYRIMSRFAGSHQRVKGPYMAACYDLQLWCQIKDPLGKNNQHIHFSMHENSYENVFSIDNLHTMIGCAGGEADRAHLVANVEIYGTFAQDWTNVVHKGFKTTTGKFVEGILDSQDKEAQQKGTLEMKPRLLEYGKLQTHITVARLEKIENGKPLAGKEDFDCLQLAYKNMARKFIPISLNIDTLRVTTQENHKMKLLGKPQQL